MNHRKNRRRFGAEFKAKVALEALSERQTLSELAEKYGIHPNQISAWKKQLLQDSAELFKRGPDKAQKDQSELIDELYKRLGQQQVELDWLKKKSGLS
jgi:transposase